MGMHSHQSITRAIVAPVRFLAMALLIICAVGGSAEESAGDGGGCCPHDHGNEIVHGREAADVVAGCAHDGCGGQGGVGTHDAENPSVVVCSHVGCGSKAHEPSLQLALEELVRRGVITEAQKLSSPAYVQTQASPLAVGDEGTMAAGESGLYVGRRELLFIRVAFPNDLTEQCTESEAYALMEEVNNWYVECSYNKMQISTTVTPQLVMPHNWQWYHNHIPTDNPDNPGPNLLVADALAAAAKLGYNVANFDLVTLRHRGGMFGGWTGLGGGGVTWLKATSVSVQVHEIGHAIGIAPHSDSYNTDGRGVIGAGDSLQSYSYLKEVVAYGEPYDVMGSGWPGHFNPIWKAQLGWLAGTDIKQITESGRYRVHAFDTAETIPGRAYALRVRKNHLQEYWLGMRAGAAPLQQFMTQGQNAKWNHNGLMLWMPGWDSQREKSTPPYLPAPVLLDTTPGTPDGKHDGSLAQGRTYSDVQSDVHVTVVDLVQAETQALDVVVNYGPFPGNRPPTLTLDTNLRQATTRQILVDVGRLIRFSASAVDPDGDVLAYHWDFGDNQNASRNVSEMTYSWGESGLYTVRVTVSDMKGGTASRSVAVNVGMAEFPATGADDTDSELGRHRFYARGRIVDQAGRPMEHVRVWAQGSNPYRGTYTNSDGSFIVSNINPGTNDGVVLRCYLDGYHFAGIDTARVFPSPVSFKFNDIDNVNFVGYRRNIVSAVPLQPEISENDGHTYFRVRRLLPQIPPETGRIGETPIPDYLNREVFVRLYVKNDAGATLETRYPNYLRLPDPNQPWRLDFTYDANGAAPGLGHTLGNWEPIRVLNEVIVRNPEIDSQVRNHETCIAQNHGSYVNIQEDLYVIIPRRDPSNPDGYEYIDIRVTPSSISGGHKPVIMMVAYSPDYWSDNDEQQILVLDEDWTPPDPAAGPTKVWMELVNGVAMENSNNPGRVAVVRGGTAEDSLTVNLQIGGTATPGLDYITLPLSVTFAPGVRRIELSVVPRPDDILEAAETVIVSIASSGAYQVVGGAATVVIHDHPRAGLTVTNSLDPAHERRGTSAVSGRFTITRVGPLDTNLYVYFSFPKSGEMGASLLKPATPGLDYTASINQQALNVTSATPLSWIIPAGETSIDIDINPVNDGILEGDEVVTILLHSSLAYDVANPGLANLIIKDSNLSYVTIATNRTTISESPGTNNNNVATLTFRRTAGDLTLPLQVFYEVSGDADLGVDYSINTGSPGMVYFPPNVEVVTALLSAFNDNILEAAETVYVTLLPRNPIHEFGGPQFYNVDERQRRVAVTITDNSDASASPQVSFELTEVFVPEGDSGDYTFTTDVILSTWPNNAAWRSTLQPAGTYYDTSCVYVDYEIIADARPGAPNPATPGVEFVLHDSNPLWDGQITGGLGPMGRRNVVYPGNYDPTNPNAYEPVNSHDLNVGETGQAGTGHYGNRLVPGGTLWFPSTNRHHNNQPATFISPANIQRRRFTFTVRGNTIPQDTRTFQVRLKWPYNCVIPQVSQGAARRDVLTVHIVDDDWGMLALEATDPEAAESGSPATNTGTVVLRRTGSAGRELQDVFIELAGSASMPDDYLLYLVNGGGEEPTLIWPTIRESGEDSMIFKVTMAQGESEKVLRVVPIDDPYSEFTENVTFRIWRADDCQFDAQHRVHVSILDNDTFTVPVVTMGFATSGDEFAAEGGKAARLTVQRNETGLSDPLTVHFNVNQLSTAIPADYVGLGNGTLTFPAGVAEMVIEVNAVDDSIAEPTETVIVALNTSESYIVQTGPRASAMGAIIYLLDNDLGLPVIGIRATNSTVLEQSAHLPGRFRITRSRDDIAPLTVNYAISGSASNGVDYATLSGSVIIPAHHYWVEVDVWPKDDNASEGDETVVLTLVASEDEYDIDPSAAYAGVTIIDDEAASISVVASQPRAREADPVVPGEFTLTRSGGDQTQPLSVQYTMTGSASNGTDYTSLSGTVSFTANASTATVVLTPIDDEFSEPDEEAILVIAPGGGSGWVTAVEPKNAATVVILDNDRNRVSVVTTVATAYEHDPDTAGVVNGVFTLHRSGPTTDNLAVRYRLTGTATRGVDYVNTYVGGQDYGELLIPAGQGSAQLVIVPINDELVEVPETVIVTLLAHTGYNLADASLGLAKEAQLTIMSDDLTRVSVEIGSEYAKLGMDPPANFILRRAGSTFGPLRVNYLMSGTAVNGYDYELLVGHADFRHGDETVAVPLIPVTASERKTVVMTVIVPESRRGSYVTAAPTSATITLLAAEDLALQVVAVDDHAVKSTQDPGLFEVRRSGAALEELSVGLTIGGTAIPVTDYQWTVPVGANASFAAGEEVLHYALFPVLDSAPQPPRTVVMQLAASAVVPPEWFLINHGRATVTIVDHPERSVSLQVLDQNNVLLPTNTYSPEVRPEDGRHRVLGQSHVFIELLGNQVYDIIIDAFEFERLMEAIVEYAGLAEPRLDAAPTGP